jgi:integrase
MARPTRLEPYILLTKGIWYISWYDESVPKRKYICLNTSDQALAESHLETFKERQRLGVAPVVVPRAGYTVSKALDDYIAEHVPRRVADPVRQQNAISHLKPFFGRLLLSDIDIPTCRAYYEARSKGTIGGWNRRRLNLRPGSDGTIRRELNVLQAAAHHALRWKRISRADFPTFEAPPDQVVTKEEGFLTLFQIATLAFEARGALRDFIVFSYAWGARRKSVEDLDISQVSLEGGRVNLNKLGSIRTKKRRPIVPIFPELKALLKIRMENSRDGQLFWPTRDFYMPFKKLCQSLGMPYSHPHVLRHSRASHMLMSGVSIYKVARLLGDSVSTIEKVYGHHSVEFLMERDR